MERIEWNDGYRIGIEHIDRQHQRLFKLVNLFFETLAMEKTDELIQPVLGGLITYTQTHFRDEETEMERLGYPDLDEHRQKHQLLTTQAAALYEQLRKAQPIDKTATAAFLKDWLTDHVLHDDKQIGVFLSQQTEALNSQDQLVYQI